MASQIRNFLFLIPMQLPGIFVAQTTQTSVILFFHQRNEKRTFFFGHSHKTFFCTKTFVDPANGQQNRHYFPLLCIFTPVLVDLINNSQVFSLKLSWIFHLFAKRQFKNIKFFFKHFCFCTLCLTVGAAPLLKLSRKRESANVKVLYFVGSDQKCGTKFSACCAYW